MDSDGDGVCDGKDQCPNTPAGCTVDDKGCPVDSDGDGVCDGLDQCANTQAGCRVDEKGCPIDSDQDGVCDGLDLCPNTPAGARVDKDGCPIEITSQETEMLDKGVITVRNIYFDTAKSDIKPESEKALNDLCTIFKQWPTLQIEIGGHADSRGAEDYNQTLTEQRSESVLNWLKTNCADANLATTQGTTALAAAAGMNWTVAQTVTWGPAALLEAVRICHEAGNDVNAANSKGMRAIHAAANRGSDDIIRYLAAHGADVQAKDGEGRTAMDWAQGVFLATHPPVARPAAIEALRKLGVVASVAAAGSQ
jgi:OOP family OmpA-OmpF porin